MMTIDEMNAIRKELGWSIRKLSMETGIPIGTLQKVLNGTTKNPRIETMRKLEDTLAERKWVYDHYFNDAEREDARQAALHENSAWKPSSPYASVREVSPFDTAGDPGENTINGRGSEVPEPPLYTVADRDALPSWRRTELIDGVLYDMAAPVPPHQTICTMIARQIDDCISEHHSDCVLFVSPTDVCLDRDEYTMIQPDVFVVCDRSQITKKNIQGAPAFILEVLSPSTRKKDKKEKLVKYMNASVREYWMIDPDTRKVIVYDMTMASDPGESQEDAHEDEDPYEVSVYGFHDRIPLAISDGKCIIDMNPIRETLDELYS